MCVHSSQLAHPTATSDDNIFLFDKCANWCSRIEIGNGEATTFLYPRPAESAL